MKSRGGRRRFAAVGTEKDLQVVVGRQLQELQGTSHETVTFLSPSPVCTLAINVASGRQGGRQGADFLCFRACFSSLSGGCSYRGHALHFVARGRRPTSGMFLLPAACADTSPACLPALQPHDSWPGLGMPSHASMLPVSAGAGPAAGSR